MTKRKQFSRADFVQALCGGDAWAISPAWATTLQGWASAEDFNPTAIVTQAGEQYGSGMTRTSVRDGVGIMQVRGPLFPHENFMSWLFGFDTYESLAADFSALMNDPAVKGVVMNYHSPGGLVAGGSDLAQMIFDARGIKPNGLVARAGGDMASMAYWLGSSAEKVHVAPTGIVGSIGTMVQFQQGDSGMVSIVSDQSPMKNADPSTPNGLAEMKTLLNSLSGVFIENVARNRGVTPDQVVENFGRGGVKVGAAAVAAGMADTLSTFESTFSQVAVPSTTSSQEIRMSGTPLAPAAEAIPAPAQLAPTAPAAVAPAIDLVQAERNRTSEILAAFEGTTFASEAHGFIKDGKSAQEAQTYVLGKMKQAPVAAPTSGVTQSQLAAEGSLAAAASLPSASGVPNAPAQTAATLRSAMVQGANGYRHKLTGGNPGASRFNPNAPK